MRLQYVVVEFDSHFHVGRYSLLDTLDYVPSDTIYSAVEWLRRIGVKGLPARVSSAYPLFPNGSLPLPIPALWRLAIAGVESLENVRVEGEADRKMLKELQYVPLECVKTGRLAIRQRAAGTHGGLAKRELVLSCGGVETVVTPGFHGEYVIRAHNRIARNTSMADTFRVAAFSPRVPYVIYFEDGDAEAFEVMGELGLGGKRGAGLGRFKVVRRGEVELPDGGEWAMVLGVARPRNYLDAVGPWEVRSWRCTHGTVGPLSVLLDGGMVRGDFEFEVVNREEVRCTKRLDPLWIWLS